LDHQGQYGENDHDQGAPVAENDHDQGLAWVARAALSTLTVQIALANQT
jgi:hypothetical protein